jgi:hypothetical protein
VKKNKANGAKMKFYQTTGSCSYTVHYENLLSSEIPNYRSETDN